MKLTPRLRKLLKKPLGEVVGDASAIGGDAMVLAVGDTASDTVLKAGLKPKMVVYDGMTARKKVGVSKAIQGFKAEEHRVANPAGHLEEEVIALFGRLMREPGQSKVFVEGEEDLTALAAIKEAPDGAVVLYGQPDEGLVVVVVDDKMKDKVNGMIEEMEDGC